MRSFKRAFKSVICSFLLTMMMVVQYLVPVYAASATISASAGTVYVGDSVTFTVNVSGGVGYLTVSGAASDYMWFDQNSKSYTVKANSVGTLTVSIEGVIADYATEEDVKISKSVSVNVIARPSNPQPNPGGNSGSSNSGGSSSGGSTSRPQPNVPQVTQSSNADLASLKLSQGTLTPEFQADVTEYSVTLEKNVTSVKVEATPADENATVSGTGDVSLEPGENTLTVNVSAEDGTTKQYVIKVSVDDAPDVFVEYNGKKLGVLKNLKDTHAPASFEETTVSLEGVDVPAWHSNLSNATIIYMVDENNERNFYLYDEVKKTIVSIFKPIGLLGRNVVIIDIPAELHERYGMKYGEITVDDQPFMGWSFEDPAFQNYKLLYLMDDKGNKQYYLYDSVENTLQLYSNQAAVTQDRYDELVSGHETRGMLILALGVTNVVTLLLLLIVAIKKRKPKKSKVVVNAKKNHHEETMQEPMPQEEEEIIPFDAWKYEDHVSDQGIHLQPYENDAHLFDYHDETINE